MASTTHRDRFARSFLPTLFMVSLAVAACSSPADEVSFSASPDGEVETEVDGASVSVASGEIYYPQGVVFAGPQDVNINGVFGGDLGSRDSLVLRVSGSLVGEFGVVPGVDGVWSVNFPASEPGSYSVELVLVGESQVTTLASTAFTIDG